MNLSEGLIKKLSKTFEPDSMITMQYRGADIAFKTDEAGHAILLFIGKKDNNGTIKGDRYARTLKYNDRDEVFKDHWERKGKAS